LISLALVSSLSKATESNPILLGGAMITILNIITSLYTISVFNSLRSQSDADCAKSTLPWDSTLSYFLSAFIWIIMTIVGYKIIIGYDTLLDGSIWTALLMFAINLIVSYYMIIYTSSLQDCSC